MPREKRAAQFAPFDALSGMREALRMAEYEHERKVKGDVSEETASKISDIINELEKGYHITLKAREETIEAKYQKEISDLKAEISQLRTILYERKASYTKWRV